jgi:hypothetical protein
MLDIKGNRRRWRQVVTNGRSNGGRKIAQNRRAAPIMPTTAPKVSRRGTRVGTAAPEDWDGGASGTPELLDVDVAGAEENIVDDPDDDPDEEVMVAVLFTEVSGVVEGVGVLDPVVDELEEVGSSTYVITMRISSHWAPMDRS